MKYCEQCRAARQWPVSVQRTFAECELCKQQRLCHERPGRMLGLDDDEPDSPEPPKES